MDFTHVNVPYLTSAMDHRIELEPRTTGHWRVTAQGSLRHPTPNGHRDPLSILCVLDWLQNLQAPAVFTTPEAVDLLEVHYKHILWESVTVGRILGEIAELAHEADPELPALTHGRSTRGARWALHTDGRRQWKWLYDARVWIQNFAETVVENETKLRATRGRMVSPWINLPAPK